MSTNGSTTSNNGVCLTVDANSSWNGRISLSGSLINGTGIQGAGSAGPAVVVNGGGGNFANGTVVTKLQLNTAAQLIGAVAGSSDHGDLVVPNITVQAGSTPVDLILVLNGATAACATAIGE